MGLHKTNLTFSNFTFFKVAPFGVLASSVRHFFPFEDFLGGFLRPAVEVFAMRGLLETTGVPSGASFFKIPSFV